MTTKSYLLLSLLFTVTTVFSQTDSISTNNYKHHVGIAAGLSTGYGMSYRFMSSNFGAQTAFAPLKNSSRTEFNIGLTFLYKLIDANITDLYLYQGNMFVYEKYDSDSYPYGTNYQYDGVSYGVGYGVSSEEFLETVEIENDFFNHSVGIGIEFIILKRVSYNLMAGYATFENFDRIGLTVESSLYYRF